MKSISIAGRLGKDAELRRTQGGDPVLGFNVAVDDGYGQNKTTLWFKCSIWGKRAEAMQTMLPKGKEVSVVGDFSTEEYQGKTQLTIRVNDIKLHGGKQDGQSTGRRDEQSSYAEESGARADDLDDDLPF
jgi:single-strand DNA-binding protein